MLADKEHIHICALAYGSDQPIVQVVVVHMGYRAIDVASSVKTMVFHSPARFQVFSF